jgi:propionyl-CoA carboxylase beta chain
MLQNQALPQLTAENDVECILKIRRLLGYLPQNCEEKPITLPYTPGSEVLENMSDLIPNNANQPYEIKEIIVKIVDQESFFEIHEDFAQNIVVGFARLAGKSIGIVANQPMVLAGCLDVNASKKAARFVRFCDCFNIPLLVLEDVPGFLPGRIRNGTESSATVPNYCMHSVKQLFQESPLSPGRLMAEHTM